MNHMKLHPEIQNFVENRKNQNQYCFELFQSIEEREEHVIEEHKSKLEWKMNEERQKLGMHFKNILHKMRMINKIIIFFLVYEF